MSSVLNYIKTSLGEYSTWLGLMLVAGSFGFEITPERQQAIIFLGMALAGAPESKLVNVLRGAFGKTTPVEDQQEQKSEDTAKEIKNADKKKALSDIIADDRDL